MNNKVRGCFGERPLPEFVVDPQALHRRTRRDVLLFGAGAMAALAGGGSLLPQDTLTRLGLRRNMNSGGKEWLLNRALRIDDDVAETLYSPYRTVPTCTRSQITPSSRTTTTELLPILDTSPVGISLWMGWRPA